MDSTIRKLLRSVPKLNVYGMVMLLSFYCLSFGLEGHAADPDNHPENEVSEDQTTVSGTITDEKGMGLPGANVVEIGTSNGTITDVDGKYSLAVGENARLLISFVGYEAVEVAVAGQSVINTSLSEDISSLQEVVVVGYGTQKKVNLTGAVSTAGKENIEGRPIQNVQQALQGVVPNLVISPNTAGGEPGSEMNMTIRGLQSFEGNNSPLVLVDNVPMNINDVNPADIESISVLKDAASSAIYGARAAYGVILITTKKGQGGAKVNYTANFARSAPTIWPEFADPLDAIYAHNDAALNVGNAPYYTAEAIDRFLQNQANPGSAPSMLPTASGDNWDIMNTGLKAVAYFDPEEVIVNRSAPITQHNLSISGGSDRVNYYVSTGFLTQEGLLKIGNESFQRFNVDAKISAKATDWMTVEFLTKFRHNNENFPWNPSYGRAWIMNWLSKLKPGLPVYYDGTDIYTLNSRFGEWEVVREDWRRRQLTLSPRLILEPIKGWVTNVQFNYVSNDNRQTTVNPQVPWVRPSGIIDFSPATREGTQFNSALYTNEYFSPNVFSSYDRSFGKHNVGVLVGYQHEVYRYTNLLVNATHLVTDEVPSISTAVGTKTFGNNPNPNEDEMGHWGTMGMFGRLNYNFDEKYLFEVNIRRDGSSRFDPNNRWGTFKSVSGGWAISNENFFPLKDQIDLLKIRASYGELGNQNVNNYLYVPTMNTQQTNYWLFSNNRPWTVQGPNLTSINLTWEKVSTIDLGLDMYVMGDRLQTTFDYYESRTTDLVSPGQELPAVLGTAVPKRNSGEIVTRGWEIEILWRDRINDFSYQVRGVLSDYQSTVESYNNPTGLLPTDTRYYEGQKLGEIWGFQTDGLYQSQEEITAHGVNTSAISGFAFNPGDVKYQDLNGDGAVNFGDNTVSNPGDQVILGNSTPRFQYGFSGNASWKGVDISFFFQGVAKRDLWPINSGGQGIFRGPAGGPMHAGALVDHIDYWRDDTSPLGANPGAYFPKPYAQYLGQNEKNFLYPHDRFLQNGRYMRLKNVQVGYTFPKALTEKVFISNARIYLSGENLLTFTKLLFFDPEAFAGRWYGAGDAYPLNKSYSLGLNVTF
ncbi:MAG: SusC/RagA family TonB-linked outer membrane protein [Bacteroidota bacterium]